MESIVHTMFLVLLLRTVHEKKHSFLLGVQLLLLVQDANKVYETRCLRYYCVRGYVQQFRKFSNDFRATTNRVLYCESIYLYKYRYWITGNTSTVLYLK